ncbi:hypothetical protein GCM10018793_31620 [Streptomyces sulfonofaciens]|uniref:3-hydroxyacyl-CoA dehydrogenase NAD binding domain-containing protein n=1 Tax=Streptomyces sulfonofaciens TaxID=68272 RepID=A0A919G8A7_9ACTN|nr:hypothetical protein GCM10018793_31620 [Streptomyces sulfonofaciens]
MCDIQRVAVVGAGQMGSGIVEVFARAGLDVRPAEATGEALESGRAVPSKSPGTAVEWDKTTTAERDAALGRLLGCARAMGPLKLSDLIGPDTLTATADSMYIEDNGPPCAAPPVLRRMVEAGRLGRKARVFTRTDGGRRRGPSSRLEQSVSQPRPSHGPRSPVRARRGRPVHAVRAAKPMNPSPRRVVHRTERSL